jgi:hypothetical protein
MSNDGFFSKRAVREFKDSLIWQEIEDTLKERMSLYNDDFRKFSPLTPEGVAKIASIQNAMNEIDYFLALPDSMVREEEQTNKEEANDGR